MSAHDVGIVVGKISLTSAGWLFTAGGGLAGAKSETQGTGFLMLILGLGILIAGAFL